VLTLDTTVDTGLLDDIAQEIGATSIRLVDLEN